MLTDNHIKEGLSRAYISAVAHRAGMSCAQSDFDYGIDGSLQEIKLSKGRRIDSGFKIDFQAKASVNCRIDDSLVTYDLEVKAHEDLIDPTVGTPRILIVLALPADPTEWLKLSSDSFVMKRCAWWASLRGQPTTNNRSTVAVQISLPQTFTPEALTQMMQRVKQGALP